MPAPRPPVTDFHKLPATLARRARDKSVVGFDVFDTLLARRVEPEFIKDLVARRLAERLSVDGSAGRWQELREQRRQLELELGRASEARGNDHEFRLRELIPRWLYGCGPQDSGSPLAAELLDYELELERRATFPTPHIAETLASLCARGLRLIFISDTYLDIADLWGLLTCHGLARYFAAGYCSSSALRTKGTGRLFQQVVAEEGILPHRMLMVGDNPYSDVQAPRRLGIEALLVSDAREVRRRTRLQLLTHLSRRNRFWVGNLAREIVETRPVHLRRSHSPDYELGVLLAPAFIAFVRDIIDQAERLGLKRLFFLSREGLGFLRLYRRMTRALGLGARAPAARYLAVSRLATFLPSLDRLDWGELRRLWRQYSGQSLRRLLCNLSLPMEEFQPLAARAGFRDLDAPIEEPEGDGPLRAFLADPQVQQRFGVHRDQARLLLSDYLAQKGFFEHAKIGLVDLGWKGTMQDNLVRAVRHRSDCPIIHGLYFALVHVPDDDLPRSHKHGYMLDTRRGDWTEEVILKNGPAFEMFSSAAHGGVVGYRRLPGESRKVKPVLAVDAVERSNLRRFATRVFAGTEDYVRDYLAVAPLIPATGDELKPYVLDQLRRYILYPTSSEARNFLRYSHVESFGVFHVSTYGFKGSWKRILLGGSPLRLLRRLVQTLNEQFWPEAAVRRSGVPLGNLLYDLQQTRYARGVALE